MLLFITARNEYRNQRLLTRAASRQATQRIVVKQSIGCKTHRAHKRCKEQQCQNIVKQ